jgi:hypothetical protein
VLSDVRQLRSITKRIYRKSYKRPHRRKSKAKYIDDLEKNAMVRKVWYNYKTQGDILRHVYCRSKPINDGINKLLTSIHNNGSENLMKKFRRIRKKEYKNLSYHISEAEPSNYVERNNYGRFKKEGKKDVPELNMGSMSDIIFIFCFSLWFLHHA